ncbi:hypothetical protein BaRGS_00031735 [Batillaria attramentaria]|uniref:Uncharacterized protein n=1 Tax=Batillaria attramentaria TaxID=370345 RepID=A0ABD0JQW7_9CAEN
MGVIVSNPFPSLLPVQLVFLALHFSATCAWVFPVAFSCTMCSVIHHWFSRLTENVKKSIEDDSCLKELEDEAAIICPHDCTAKCTMEHAITGCNPRPQLAQDPDAASENDVSIELTIGEAKPPEDNRGLHVSLRNKPVEIKPTVSCKPGQSNIFVADPKDDRSHGDFLACPKSFDACICSSAHA